ncbi:MAG: 4-hydroxyproline epimerase [Gammaproteobacteria bacterium]|nr:4-hydroxyproline epimerase [Gammaproteobacteria bacterium]
MTSTKQIFKCIDAHTCGNPVRVVIDNRPDLQGQTMIEKRQDFENRYDWIRRGLMFEPRGHDAMSGSIIYPPINADSDLSILFIEVSGCLPMCGHGTIGTVTVAIEEELVVPKTPGVLILDTPAGKIEAEYSINKGTVESVKLANVTSFLHSTDLIIEVPMLGMLKVDVSYGGNFYAIVEKQENFDDLEQLSVDQIRYLSPIVRDQINAIQRFEHPQNPLIHGVSHVMWTGKPLSDNGNARNAVFYGERGIDRSPCGTGTSARMAQLVQRGDLEIGETFIHESIIGSQFIGQAIAATSIGQYPAIQPAVQGWAKVTGRNDIIIDELDPYAHGFILA